MVVLSQGSPPSSPPGRALQVGFYQIIRTLGKGNFAVVKLACHKVTKTQVAIKIIDKTKLEPADLERIYREVQIMKLLNHPHIIKLYQVMESKDMLYMVMEYAKNGEMFDYLASSGRLSESEARGRFWQILTAVEYCHKNHIVHRDLKAENLLLDSNMDIKLADFGFGNFFSEGAALGTWCGSPPYAAPEVFEGREYEGPPLDIWSLGVVLYVLVCGSLPFDAPTLPVLRQRVTEGRFRVPYFMSQDCESLARSMLSVDPAKRITMAQIKQHRWLQAGPAAGPLGWPRAPERQPYAGEHSEPVLAVMQSMGIDRQRTIESLQNSSYNHFSALYCLLLEKMDEPRCHRPSGAAEEVSPAPGPAPSSLLQTSIYEEEDRHGDLGEELEEEEGYWQATPLSLSPSRRHTLAAVAAGNRRNLPPSLGVRSPTETPVAPPHSPMPGPPAQLQVQISLPLTWVQGGCRASDTSLTQVTAGLRAVRQQLRRDARAKGLLGFNKTKSPGRQMWLPASGPWVNRGPSPLCVPPAPLAEGAVPQHRVLQIPLHRFLASAPSRSAVLFVPQQSPAPPPAPRLPPAVSRLTQPPTPESLQLQHAHRLSPELRHHYLSLPSPPSHFHPCSEQPLDLSSSSSSSSSSSAMVTSTAQLLECRLHISQRPPAECLAWLRLQPPEARQPAALWPHAASASLESGYRLEPWSAEP